MITITTTRFGQTSVDEKHVVHFPEGLLGFSGQKDYAILEHKPGSPFYWLQSLEVPELAFVITDPFLIKANYLSDLEPEEENLVYGDKSEQMVVFALVTIPPGHIEKMTVNLQGPLIIHPMTKIGKQVVLANSGYHHQQPFRSD